MDLATWKVIVTFVMSDENKNQISMDWEEGGGKSGIIMCVDGLRETVREESNGETQ